MEQNFIPLLFGGDINVYSVARAFHEAYGIRSSCFGKYPSGPAYASDIIDYHTCARNEDPAVFMENVRTFAAAHPDKTVFVIGCGDSYVQLAAEHRQEMPANCIAPYIDGSLLDTLINKEEFYRICDEQGIDHPATFIHRREMGHDFQLPFQAPFVCKPSDGVAYWAHPFPGNDKVFICKTRAELDAVLDRVYAGGYPGSMVIQDFIPGDDSYMRVLTNYSDRTGRVKMQCMGHVLLEEHTPHGAGNHAVIITEPAPEITEKLRAFLDGLGYVGFSNFDIKYDKRDGKFKVFEINCRQGRSNYYVTGAGHNLAKLLVEDYIEQRELTLTVNTRRTLWRTVPQRVAMEYIVSAYHRDIRTLTRQGRCSNPLLYRADHALMHRLRIWKNQLGHFYKFRKYYGRKA